MKGGFGRPNPLSYVHIMKQVMIAKVIWKQGSETFYGPFDSYERYVKWSEELMDEIGSEVDEILFDWLHSVTEVFEERN